MALLETINFRQRKVCTIFFFFFWHSQRNGPCILFRFSLCFLSCHVGEPCKKLINFFIHCLPSSPGACEHCSAYLLTREWYSYADKWRGFLRPKHSASVWLGNIRSFRCSLISWMLQTWQNLRARVHISVT